LFAQTASLESDAESEDGKPFFNFGFCTNLKSTSNSLSKTRPKTTPLKLRKMILLDNQSTVNLFCNRKLVSRVWEPAKSMTVYGNGGSLATTMKAHVMNYGEIWYDTRAITNILSLINVRKQIRATYDSED
jgi:hypothetical protein